MPDGPNRVKRNFITYAGRAIVKPYILASQVSSCRRGTGRRSRAPGRRLETGRPSRIFEANHFAPFANGGIIAPRTEHKWPARMSTHLMEDAAETDERTDLIDLVTGISG